MGQTAGFVAGSWIVRQSPSDQDNGLNNFVDCLLDD